ncbi:MAG: hypothetical protein GY771_06260 [bacterium]|nr:hypothetical protein [bacterium]
MSLIETAFADYEIMSRRDYFRYDFRYFREHRAPTARFIPRADTVYNITEFPDVVANDAVRRRGDADNKGIPDDMGFRPVHLK